MSNKFQENEKHQITQLLDGKGLEGHIPEVRCPICDGLRCTEVSVLYDDRYGFPGYFKLLKCNDCGHRFLDAEFTQNDLKKLYTEYYPRSNYDISQFEPHKNISRLKSWITGAKSQAFRWVPPGVKILDIGCGFGEALGYHRSRGCDVYGVEADENILAVAEKYGYQMHVGLFDASNYEKVSFDYVTMDQVIEHVCRPVDFLRDVATVLKPGGLLILSTPNPESWGAIFLQSFWINWHIPYHLHFFSMKSMKMAADMAGFEVISCNNVTHASWMYYQWVHMLTKPPANMPSHFWTSRDMVWKEKFIVKICRLIHYSLFDHILTRIADACNHGDNRVFMLKKI